MQGPVLLLTAGEGGGGPSSPDYAEEGSASLPWHWLGILFQRYAFIRNKIGSSLLQTQAAEGKAKQETQRDETAFLTAMGGVELFNLVFF